MSTTPDVRSWIDQDLVDSNHDKRIDVEGDAQDRS
jgi:hypothetical protein